MIKKISLLFSIALFFSQIFLVEGATINVGSLSPSVIQGVINSSSTVAGDILVLPAGSAVWTSTVTVNKPITIKGAGADITTVSSTSAQLFSILASSKTQVTRITGMSIDGGEAVVGIGVDCAANISEYGLFRIDHCKIFHCTLEGVDVINIMNGVIDHCTFYDNYLMIGQYAGFHMDHSWQLPLTIGSTNCTVTEDCIFLHTAGGYMPFRGTFENGQGARLVLRHCFWTNFTSAFMSPIFDSHGNQGVVDTVNNVITNPNGGGVRGTRSTEIYNNIWDSHGGGGGYKVYYRGGVLMTFNNQWIGSGLDTGWRISEEDGTARFNIKSSYPGWDQHEMWSWNNTQNGSPITTWYSAGNVNTGGSCNDNIFLLTGQNVFWVPPSDTAQSTPVASPAITNYTPLIYPHPLVTLLDGGNLPPTVAASGNPTSGVKPLTVNFSSAGSSDPEGVTITYSWDFGDGQTSTSANPTHTYVNKGQYTVQLTVSDGVNTSSTTVPISVLANANGLIAAYGFEEGSGPAVFDISGNDITGYLTNLTWTTSGKYGNGIVFGASSTSLIGIPETPLLDITGPITLSAWVFPTVTPNNWENIILKGGPNPNTAALPYILNGFGMPSLNPSFFISPASSGVFGLSKLPLNTWTYLTGTYDGSTMKIYVNGVLVNSAAQAGTITATADNLFIGGNPYFGHNFVGTIDEVRIYNRALSQPEIQTDMNTPLSSKKTSILTRIVVF